MALPWTYSVIHRVKPWQLGAAFRALLRVRPRVEVVQGLKVWLDPTSNMGYRLLTDGDLEGDMSAGIQTILQPGDVFVDLGGNEGWYSLLAARRVGRAGRVLCVEPQERLWPVVLRNFALNDMAQAELVPLAVGTEAEAEMALAPGVNTGASSIAVKGGWRRLVRKHQKVLMRPLDDVVLDRGVEKVKLLKIDIEGYELNALRSAKRLLAERRIEHILMEFHDAELRALGQDRSAVVGLLQEHGFEERSSKGGVYHYALARSR